MKETFDDLYTRLLLGETLSEEEIRDMEEGEKESDINRFLGRELRGLARQKSAPVHFNTSDTAFRKIRQSVQTHRTHKRRLRWSVAASILLLTGSALFFIQRSAEEAVSPVDEPSFASIYPGSSKAELLLPGGERMVLPGEGAVFFSDSLRAIRTMNNTLIHETGNEDTVVYFTLQVPTGGEFKLKLADGTHIHLNAGSSLRYPSRFDSSLREVFLAGEAFFDVAPDQIPFVVNTPHAKVRVLGTSFNINAYPSRSKEEITLVNGSVETRCGEQVWQQLPGEQVQYDPVTGKSNKQAVETELYTSWKEGYYLFREAPLREIMEKFALWYDLEIIFKDSLAGEKAFTGRFKRYEDIIPHLKKMEYTRDLQFTIKDKTITIESKKTD